VLERTIRMAHPLYHSRASVYRYGGRSEDYLPLHSFLDQTKALIADCRHRLILHNAWGIEIAVARFGAEVAGVPTADLATDHIIEDLRRVPTLADSIPVQPEAWWSGGQLLEDELETLTLSNHAMRSTRRFGGQAADYRMVHLLLDSPARHVPDWRHRLPTHNAWGPFLCEAVLGAILLCADGREVPTRAVAEDHIQHDLGGIPPLSSALAGITLEVWMCRDATPLSKPFGSAQVMADRWPRGRAVVET
jgi:hypothetical protein